MFQRHLGSKDTLPEGVSTWRSQVVPQLLPPGENLGLSFALLQSWGVKSGPACKSTKEFEICFGQFNLELFPFSSQTAWSCFPVWRTPKWTWDTLEIGQRLSSFHSFYSSFSKFICVGEECTWLVCWGQRPASGVNPPHLPHCRIFWLSLYIPS